MFDIIIGLFAVTFGIFTLVQRKRNPGSFHKIDAMKKAYGEKAGYAIHVVSYSLIPILFGIAILVSSLVFGVSILG